MAFRLAASALRPALKRVCAPQQARVIGRMSNAELTAAWQSFHTHAHRWKAADADAAAVAVADEEEEADRSWDLTRQQEVPEGFIQKFQLNHWTRWVPLSLLGFAGMTAAGSYHIDAETQLLCVFAAFVAVAYAKGAKPLADMLDDTRHGMLKEHEEAEGVVINAMEDYRDALAVEAELDGDVEKMFGEFRALEGDMAAAYTRQHKIDTRDSFVKFMDLRLAEQNEFVSNAHTELIEKTTADVRKTFDGSKELRDASLSSAIAAVGGAGGDGGGDDPVVALYAKTLKANVKTLKADLQKEVTLDAKAKAEWTEKWQERVRRVGYGFEEEEAVMNLPAPDKMSYAKLL